MYMTAPAPMIKVSASTETNFPSNFNPDHPPNFDRSYQVHPELTQRYGRLAGSLVQEIELKRNHSPPRMYLFNKMAVNKYFNEDFKALFHQAIRLCIYKRFCLNIVDWEEIVRQSSIETVNMVLSALILTNTDLRLQYQPPQNEIPHLQQIFQTMNEIERDVEIMLRQLSSQTIQPAAGISPMQMNHMMPGMPMVGHPNEPMINVPGYGLIPQSMFNQLVLAQQQQMAAMQQPVMMGMPHQQPLNISGIIGQAPIQNNASYGVGQIPAELAGKIVNTPTNFQQPINTVGAPTQTLVGNNPHAYVDDDDDYYEYSNSGQQNPTPPNQPQITNVASAAQEQRVELYKGKPVYRSQSDPDHFYLEYDESLPLTIDEQFKGVPALRLGQKHMYKVSNQDGRVSVIAIFRTQEELEKMDIKRHEVLMSEDEYARQRYESVHQAVMVEPKPIERSVKEDKTEYKIPEFTHIVENKEQSILDPITTHQSVRITSYSEKDDIPAVTTISYNFDTFIDTFSDEDDETIHDLAELLESKTTLYKIRETLLTAKENSKDNFALRTYVSYIDKRFTKSINKRLSVLLSSDASISSFVGAYQQLIDGMTSTFGHFIVQAFGKFERDIINESLSRPVKSIQDEYLKSLSDDKKIPTILLEKLSIVYGTLEAHTTIRSLFSDLDLDLKKSVPSVLDETSHPILHALINQVFEVKDKEQQKISRHFIHCVDGTKIEVVRSTIFENNYFLILN